MLRQYFRVRNIIDDIYWYKKNVNANYANLNQIPALYKDSFIIENGNYFYYIPKLCTKVFVKFGIFNIFDDFFMIKERFYQGF